MKERPILFQGDMVRAILNGTKTQTRRLVKPQFEPDAVPAEMGTTTPEGWQTTGHSGLWWCDAAGAAEAAIRSPYGVPGDRLWVRETWAYHLHAQAALRDEDGPWVYAADGPHALQQRLCDRWRPSIHMPRAASRITLEVTGVRVERLQEISEADATAEGAEPLLVPPDGGSCPHVEGYRALWEQINGAGSWAANPWVWVVEFRRLGGRLMRRLLAQVLPYRVDAITDLGHDLAQQFLVHAEGLRPVGHLVRLVEIDAVAVLAVPDVRVVCHDASLWMPTNAPGKGRAPQRSGGSRPATTCQASRSSDAFHLGPSLAAASPRSASSGVSKEPRNLSPAHSRQGPSLYCRIDRRPAWVSHQYMRFMAGSCAASEPM